ncbi:MAG: MgtC/SapB family protein, partial [Acetobacteraceae bacterium]|nr:MgtC/SapB family protein [Acetobacteraceae bacterium]
MAPGDVALRLGLAFGAGVLFGFNRGERGHAAGIRTTLLVCFAAALAMLLAMLLLEMQGSFNPVFRADPMRLPLGILTGMGFLGGGAILRRGDMVRGMTTAATLWFITVVGICFGAGQIAVGIVACAVGLVALEILRWAEGLMHPDRIGTLCVES